MYNFLLLISVVTTLFL